MTQTRPNGIVVPINSDAYNLTADLAAMADKANVVIVCASQAARDSLTVVTGMVVIRTDLPGAPFEKWDGSLWRRSGSQTWQFDRSASTDSTFTTANTNLVSGTITAAPAGNYRIDAVCSLYASTGAVVGYVFSKAGSTQTNRRWDLTDTSHPVSPPSAMNFPHPGGDLAVSAGYSVSSGSAVVTGSGSGLTSVIVTFLGN
jgi:hypothetical protein